MKNLFFVSVFLFFSGTYYKSHAQRAPRFIEDIEIHQARGPHRTAIVQPEPLPVVNGMVDKEITEMCNSLQFKYAQLTDREVEAIQNIRLYNFIEQWYNTRYRLGGNDEAGIDCSSFTARLIQQVYHHPLPRTAREQYAITTRIREQDIREGDLVFFKTGRGISHVGVYLDNGYFVHASTSNGVIISALSEAYYAKRFKGAGRIIFPAQSFQELCD